MLDLDSVLSVALAAAHAAGEIILASFGKEHEIKGKRSARDLVTEVDHAAQGAILKIIRKEFPDHRFIAEEQGAKDLGDPRSPFVWIIDPLDGTTNLVHGKKSCGTLIALQENGVTVLGVMFNPSTGTLYQCIRGRGVSCNTHPVRLRATRDLTDAILCTNMASRAGGTERIKVIEFPVCGSVQNYGCAMEEMAEILRGENDGVFFDGVGLWDIAPGCLMIEEAGGKSRTEFKDPNDPWKGVRCVASTEPIFEELYQFVFGRDT